MKIKCQNCGATDTKHIRAMMKAGFRLWHLACRACGQQALVSTSDAAAAIGAIKTDKKAASSRANGKKGGRPVKWTEEKKAGIIAAYWEATGKRVRFETARKWWSKK